MLLKCYNQSVDVFRPTNGVSTVDEVSYVKTTVTGIHIGDPSYGADLIGKTFSRNTIGEIQSNPYTIFMRQGVSTDFDFKIGDIVCKPSDSNVPLEEFSRVVAINPRMSKGVLHHIEVEVL